MGLVLKVHIGDSVIESAQFVMSHRWILFCWNHVTLAVKASKGRMSVLGLGLSPKPEADAIAII